ncbi:uncharacterized protein LOC103359263 isoform X2 [Stegastes partitus]|uniref:Uncharacterized LOC103359263 n=1 Tax=Stegastes partitus TaxID=144197 RepID=A0A3B5ASK6_9TELE|nr:PREDICTED: uncharacterized protein LOC103359263 isoform X2 [Stegastes partitus]
MYGYLFSVFFCVWISQSGFCAEDCSQSILAKRGRFSVPAGGSVSLSCVVQHCGHTWTGTWMWKNSTYEKSSTVQGSARHHLTNVTLSANQTRLVLEIVRADRLDGGSYQCSVVWGGGNMEQGHLTNVNITTAVPSQRLVWHRVLICAAAALCLPIVLGLALCLRSEVKPQLLPPPQLYTSVQRTPPGPAPKPPPRCPAPHKTGPKPQQRTEIVYAHISQDALRQQGATRESDQATVYSAVRFS